MSYRVHNFHDVLRNGTEVTESAYQSGVGTTIVHTVTAGTTFYVDHFTGAWWADTVGFTYRFGVRNVANADQYYFVNIPVSGNDNGHVSGCFPTLLTIAAGWDVFVYSSGAGGRAHGYVHGWEL